MPAITFTVNGERREVDVPADTPLLYGPSVISKEYGDRLNQLDVRIGKLVRMGATRTTFTFDVYNLFNGNAAQFENNRAQTFRSPTSIQLARFIKLGAQFDF